MSAIKKLNHAKLITGLLFFIVVIGVLGNIFQFHRQPSSSAHLIKQLAIGGTLLKTPREIAPFSLTDSHGKPFTKASLQGHWTLMFFGFTHCGYICPTTMAELSRMYQKLIRSVPKKEIPQVVFVSIDPARDTVARLNEYVTAFHSDFIGVRGDEEAVKQLGAQMSVVYMKLQGDAKSGNYSMNHSGAIMLLGPKGNLRAFLTSPHKATEMAHDYQAIMRAVREKV